MNDRAGMNSGCEFYRGRRELDDNLLKCFRRILHSNDGSADLFGEIKWSNNSGGAGLAQLRKVTRIVEKRDFVDGGFGQRSCTGDFCLGIPLQLPAGELRDLVQSNRHASLLNCRGGWAPIPSPLGARGAAVPKLRWTSAATGKERRDDDTVPPLIP